MVIAENILSFVVFAGIAFALFLIQYWKNRALKFEVKNQKELVDAVLKESEVKIMDAEIDDLIDLGNEHYGKGRGNSDNKAE